MINIQCKLRELRYDLRYKVMIYPSWYFTLTKVGDRGGSIVNKNTDIVIEGFPRSANTFAVNGFRLAQNQQLNIAHHKHSVAQIIRAIDFKIPTLLLIRAPQDAVASFLVREPCLSINKALKYYFIFYHYLLPYRDNLVVAKFDTVINNYGIVIEAVNQKFNKEFQLFNHTKFNVERCFKGMEKYSKSKSNDGKITEHKIPRPSVERTEKTMNLKADIQQPRFAKNLAEAEKIYNLFLLKAV